MANLDTGGGGGGIPSGVITMWSGSTSDIPDGWVLCDGSGETPDLRDRFVVGAGGQYASGDTGGADEVQLSTSEMPSHDHGGQTTTDGSHTHNITTWNPDYRDDGVGEGGYENGPTGSTDAAGSHSHSIEAEGGDQAHENRPPYYALAYIMKT